MATVKKLLLKQLLKTWVATKRVGNMARVSMVKAKNTESMRNMQSIIMIPQSRM